MLKPFKDYAKWEGVGLPTRENCDLDNPRQKFLWMFTAPPGVVGAPLMLPTEYWEHMSYRMVECGARLGGRRTVKYQPSQDSMMNRYTAAGKWVSIDTPDLPGKTLEDVVDEMSQADQIALGKVVLDKMGLSAVQSAVPEGHMPVTELATRLEVNVDRLLLVLAEFGLDLDTDSYVSMETAERLVTHLGL